MAAQKKLRVGVSYQFFCVLKSNAKFLDLEKVVTPVKTGVQLFQGVLDPGFRRGDDPKDFYGIIKIAKCKFSEEKAFIFQFSI